MQEDIILAVLVLLLFLGITISLPITLIYMKYFLGKSKCKISLELPRDLFKEGERITGTLNLQPFQLIDSESLSIVLAGTKNNFNRNIKMYEFEQELERNRIFLPGVFISYDFSFSFPVNETDPQSETLTKDVNVNLPQRAQTPSWKLKVILKTNSSSIIVKKAIILVDKSGNKLTFK
jgi:hypothetical protein